MDAAARRRLESIKVELQDIIRELNDIAAGVQREFEGIGGEHCASDITKVMERYQWVKRQLNNID